MCYARKNIQREMATVDSGEASSDFYFGPLIFQSRNQAKKHIKLNEKVGMYVWVSVLWPILAENRGKKISEKYKKTYS